MSNKDLSLINGPPRSNSRSGGDLSERGSNLSQTSQSTLTKSTRATFTLMDKRLKYHIVVDEMDLTPDSITDREYVTMDETITHAAFGSRPRIKSELGLKPSKHKSRSATDTGMKVYATTITLDDIHIDHTKNTGEGLTSDEYDLDVAPSAFYLSKINSIMSYPKELFIVLKETETHFLFELPSFSYEKGTVEGSVIEEQNEFYQYITVGKGKNRKMVTEETQTQAYVTQSRHTLATRPQKKNAIAFASLWDMHDTYSQLAKITVKEEEDEMVMYQSVEPKLLRKKKQPLVLDLKEGKGKTFEEISRTQQFLDAVLLTERILATFDFCKAQKKFRGLIPFDPLALDLVYIYSMKPLWIFECQETAGRPVVSVSFNPKNENILAVGHGKFAYADNLDGFVSIWCTKNPSVPERLYRFENPLTAVRFSDKKPHWLACGFTNGDVLILDVTSYTIKTIAKSIRETNPCFEPIWAINWRAIDSQNEDVITACQDGRINKFRSTKTHDFICSPMMRISTVEGKMTGLQTAKTCVTVDVPITRYPAALCIRWHTRIDHIYFVGTDEGCIHKCSTHYLNQHIDVQRAHMGPVYSIQFSPFMDTLLVSCGADKAVRLWLEEIDEVIMTLNCPTAVYDIAFCPINSTVIISISGNVLSIWDLRRKNHIPCAEYTFPGNVLLTYVKFSQSGDNVFVGDTLGRIHTFHLEDTPIPAFNQRKMLDEAIKKALCTRPHLLKQLEKIEKFRERF